MVKGCLIVNPAAGRGGARKNLAYIIDCFAKIGVREILTTEAAGDEDRLTRAALDLQCRTIIVVGGDGTCSRVADAMLRFGADSALTVVPAGTGNDFAKTLGLEKMGADAIAQLVAAGNNTRIDVGLADNRCFLNSCGFGFDSSVLEATTQLRFLKGDALYIYSALTQLFSYRGLRIGVEAGPDDPKENRLMLTVSNGRFLGGAFHIAPEASVLDGMLDVCVVQEASVLQRVRLFASALRGTHGRLPSVRTFRTSNMSLTFPMPPAIELDGELRRAQSNQVTIECVPRALNVIAAPGAPL